MPRFEPHPQRRTGRGGRRILRHRRGHRDRARRGRASRSRSARGGPAQCEEIAATIRAGGGEAIGLPLDVTDADSVKPFHRDGDRRARARSRSWSAAAGDLAAEPVHEMDTASSIRQLQIHLVGAHRLVAAVVPGMVSASAATSSSSPPTWSRSPRPHMGAYVAAKHGARGHGAGHADGAGGHRRAGVDRPPRPDADRHGLDWDRETTQAVLEDWAKWGQARHHYFLRPADVAAAVITFVVGAARRAT